MPETIYYDEIKEDTALELNAEKPAAYSVSAFAISQQGGLLPTSSLTDPASLKFGGSGADGPLTLASGANTIDLGSSTIKIYNYSSVSITGAATLSFTSPATAGTIIYWKVSGDVNITSTGSPAIDLRSLGGTNGTGGAIGGTGSGNGGGGGASAINNGVAGAGTSTTGGTVGTVGTTTRLLNFNSGGGGGISGAGGTAGVSAGYNSLAAQYLRLMVLAGSGGGGGQGGNLGAGGDGGRGAGALLIECAGTLNINLIVIGVGADGRSEEHTSE